MNRISHTALVRRDAWFASFTTTVAEDDFGFSVVGQLCIYTVSPQVIIIKYE